LEHQEAFKKAVDFAQLTKDDPLYVSKARGTEMTSYNVAVQDWFGQPEVLEIDTSEWTGQVGQTIHVRAKDNIAVRNVRLRIDNGNGTTFEEGRAVQGNEFWWRYTTKSAVSLASTARIVATAEDLPGNSSELVWQNN
jgi:hypothetical protein